MYIAPRIKVASGMVKGYPMATNNPKYGCIMRHDSIVLSPMLSGMSHSRMYGLGWIRE